MNSIEDNSSTHNSVEKDIQDIAFIKRMEMLDRLSDDKLDK
jgi:hypothetical protein